MNCSQCGAALQPGAAFCAGCGARQPGPAAYAPGCGQPPASPPFQAATSAPPLSVGGYLVLFVVSSLPLVGLVMLVVWAASADNPNKKNYARAMLVVNAVFLVLSIVFAFAATGTLLG